MSQLTPDQTQAGWDDTAEAYEAVVPDLTSLYAEDAIARLDIQPGQRVLDVGAGTGAASRVLAARGASVLATDFAPRMIDLLRQRAARDGAKNIRAEVMDGQALDLEDASFDAAVSFFGLIFFPDRAAGLSEMRRVLVPGGRALVASWAEVSHVPAIAIWGQAMARAIPDFQPPATPPPVFSLSDPGVFAKEMESAGFHDVDIDHIDRDLYLADSPESYWERWSVAAPVFKIFLDAQPERAAAVGEALVALLRERFGDGPVVLPQRALIGIGTA